MFFEDAEKASRVLGITLTSRNKGDENEVPMCGVPYHAVSSYLSKLVQAGFRVAICGQVEEIVGINFLNVSTGNFLISEAPINEGRFDLVEDEITRTALPPEIG